MNQSSASAAAVKPLNILIVDDSATMRALLHRVVGLADLPIGTIYQAPNGLEALKILETHSVQAVFTDLNMPVMNGMQLLREMAKRDSWKICCASSSRPTARSCGAKKRASSTSTCTSKSHFDRR